jgi:hypothetical protein
VTYAKYSLPFRLRSCQSLDDLTICDVNALFFSRNDWSSRVLDNSSYPLSAPVQAYQSLGIITITIMTGVKEDFVIPFTGALQASLAVLLTIFYGVIAAQFDLLTEKSAKDISKACVRLFLPALLIVNVGQQLSIESVSHRSESWKG